MCGRYLLYHTLIEIFERFYVDQLTFDKELFPRYNIAPSQQVLAVVHDGQQNRMGYLKWGLVPRWAKDPSIGHKLINARAETLAEKPSFAEGYKRRRCLIVASGFYEWKKEDSHKTPMLIHLAGNQLFSFAGLWERWVDSNGRQMTTCTIITTTPNELMKDIHNRMPVILSPDQEKVWLDRNIDDTQILNKLLVPYPAEQMRAYTVSNEVNSPKNDYHSLVEKIK